MDDRIEKLQNMQTTALIDVVKNYKKYNYPIEIKDAAIQILNSRGIKQESLKLSGNLNNIKYDEATLEYQKYNINSIVGLVFYILSIFVWSSNFIVGLAFSLASLLFVGISFTNTKKISKLIDDDKIDYSIIYVLISMIFYFVLFFITRHQIKEAIHNRT